MERKNNGYSVSIQWKTTPNGITTYQKDVVYMPDENTEIKQSEGNVSTQLRDVTDQELNEIMCELENEQTIKDSYPLKNIRIAALQ